MALGTGGRAGSASTQAQADNPANLPVGHLAHVETLFVYQPQLDAMSSGASVVDGMTSGYFALGFSTRWLFGGKNSGWEGKLGLGVPIGQMISLGVSGRFSNFTVYDKKARAENYDDPPPLPGQDPDPEDHRYKLHKVFTMDAALTIRPFEGFTISGLAYNVINTKSPLAPMLVGGSVSFGKDAISLGGDVLVDLNMHKQFSGVKLQIGGGIEYLTGGVAPLRAGYLYDQGRQQHAITFGIGYLTKQFSAQISLRQYVAGAKDTTLFSAIQYFVQ